MIYVNMLNFIVKVCILIDWKFVSFNNGVCVWFDIYNVVSNWKINKNV